MTEQRTTTEIKRSEVGSILGMTDLKNVFTTWYMYTRITRRWHYFSFHHPTSGLIGPIWERERKKFTFTHLLPELEMVVGSTGRDQKVSRAEGGCVEECCTNPHGQSHPNEKCFQNCPPNAESGRDGWLHVHSNGEKNQQGPNEDGNVGILRNSWYR